jgi:hypothetical protein
MHSTLREVSRKNFSNAIRNLNLTPLKLKFLFFSASIFLVLSVHAQTNYIIPINTDKPIKRIEIIKPFQRKKLGPEAIRVGPTENKVYIDFVGTGDIQKSVSEGKDINANTGLGIVFERYNKIDGHIQSFELEGTINIATTADSINANVASGVVENQRSFGTYVINPVSARQSLFINSNVYFGYPEGTFFKKFANIVSGINFKLISSNNVWTYNGVSKNLGVLSFRGGVFHEFVPDNYRLSAPGESDESRSKYSIQLGLAYSYRGIFGDVRAEKNKDFRRQILGSTQLNYSGFEATFGFKLNNIRADFQMPLLKAKDGSVDGLTNTQFIFSIRFVGGFALKINSGKERKSPTNSPVSNPATQ